jgi:hypothetical protein
MPELTEGGGIFEPRFQPGYIGRSHRESMSIRRLGGLRNCHGDSRL